VGFSESFALKGLNIR